MAFYGKEFKFQKEENFASFLRAMGTPEEKIPAHVEHKPSLKLEKDGDTYTLHTISPQQSKVVKFKSGVETEEEVRDGLPVKVTNIVDGNILTHIYRHKNRATTLKREFSADNIKTTITAENWDGVAYTYHTAA